MDNFEKVKELLVDQLYLSDPDAVTPDAEIKALGADSLDIMSLLMAIEDSTASRSRTTSWLHS